MRDKFNSSNLKIQHIFKGERPDTNFSALDWKTLGLFDGYTRGYSGLRVGASRSFNKSDPNDLS